MRPRGIHAAIRAWANKETCPEPDGPWQESTPDGFGCLHALAEEESASLLPTTHWNSKATRSMLLGASAVSGDHLMGHSPLHWCAWHGAPGVAWALLDFGAPQCPNRMGQLPVDVCRSMIAGSSGSPRRKRKLEDTLAALLAHGERTAIEYGLPPTALGRACPVRI